MYEKKESTRICNQTHYHGGYLTLESSRSNVEMPLKVTFIQGGVGELVLQIPEVTAWELVLRNVNFPAHWSCYEGGHSRLQEPEMQKHGSTGSSKSGRVPQSSNSEKVWTGHQQHLMQVQLVTFICLFNLLIKFLQVQLVTFTWLFNLLIKLLQVQLVTFKFI